MGDKVNMVQKTHVGQNRDSERGFVMIMTLLVLVVLTISCLAGLDSSSFEVQIAANDRQSRVAFNAADGSVYSIGKLMSEVLETSAEPVYAGIDYANILDPADPDFSPLVALGDADAANIDKIPNAAGVFRDRLFGFQNPRTDGKFDLMYHEANSTSTAFVRVDKRQAEIMAGGGAEFAAGAHGAGTGSSAGTAVTVDLVAEAYSMRNTRATIAARYRKVLGGAGGL